MNQQKSLIRISELLARFKFQTIILNSNAQLDINIVAEDVLVPIINLVYDCDLVNVKYSEDDNKFPALDLLDRKNKMAIQITSTSTITKIKKTLDGIIKNKFYENFDDFYIYIITQKQNSYDNNILNKYSKNLFKFDKKNIIDETDLFKKISSLKYEKIVQVEKLLEVQFSDYIKGEEKILKGLNSVILDLKEDLSKKIIDYIKIRNIWLEKKIFFENKLPFISDIGQEFSIIKNIEEINKKIEEYNHEISNLLIQETD